MTDNELKCLFGLRLGQQVNEIIEIKRRLHQKGYCVGIFSNTTPLDFEQISRERPEVTQTFDEKAPAIYSFQNDSLKPEPKMYSLVGGFRTVTFIDDKHSYLKTGVEQFGWNGILFTPFIDNSEAIRTVHTSTEKPRNNFREAASVQELKEALDSFGFSLTD